MKKKFYMQPQTEVTRSFYNDNLMDDFQVSTLGGDGPVVIGQDELMKYARSNDGSPNSIISSILFKALCRALNVKERDDITQLSSGIVCNYRKDVGCPRTYRDLVRKLRIRYLPSRLPLPWRLFSRSLRERKDIPYVLPSWMPTGKRC